MLAADVAARFRPPKDQRALDGVARRAREFREKKAHGRRWCGMAVCGNRVKAAAHRARKRGR